MSKQTKLRNRAKRVWVKGYLKARVAGACLTCHGAQTIPAQTGSFETCPSCNGTGVEA